MNQVQPVITNSTVKILRYILKHQNITFEKLNNHFKELDFMELVNLCLTGYLLCTKPGQLPTDFSDGNFFIDQPDRLWVSPKAEQFLQERHQYRLQWIIPTVISGIALILSIITLLLSQVPRVTEVRILP